MIAKVKIINTKLKIRGLKGEFFSDNSYQNLNLTLIKYIYCPQGEAIELSLAKHYDHHSKDERGRC